MAGKTVCKDASEKKKKILKEKKSEKKKKKRLREKKGVKKVKNE